jgi:hypothetical protein
MGSKQPFNDQLAKFHLPPTTYTFGFFTLSLRLSTFRLRAFFLQRFNFQPFMGLFFYLTIWSYGTYPAIAGTFHALMLQPASLLPFNLSPWA